MSKTSNLSSSVRRLFDMLVEEVSLVDRAANKHRFLIVKRNATMNERSETQKETLEDKSTFHAQEERDVSLSQALSALEELTELVRGMRDRDTSPSQEVISSISSKLQHLLTAQSTDHKSHGDSTEDKEPSRTIDKDDGDSSKEVSPKTLADVSQMFQEKLSELQSSLQTMFGAPPSGALSSGSVDDGETLRHAHQESESAVQKRKDSLRSSRALSPEIKQLMTHMVAVAEAVQSQQGRIHQMEKFVGLPNSTEVENTKEPQSFSPSSWPMDMNRPLDREAVDKSISFHDASS